MAGNYAQLLDIINNPTQHGLPAWDNNAKQIEGETIQQYLLSIINSLTVGYQFMGVASENTSGGTPDQNVFYLAGAGTYTGFSSNAITIDAGYIGIICWNGAWSSEPIKITDIISVSQNQNTGNTDILAGDSVIGTVPSVVEFDTASRVASPILLWHLSVGSSFVPFDIHQNDLVRVKVSGVSASANISIGTHIYSGDQATGFTQLLLSGIGKTEYEAFVAITTDANYFKLYSSQGGGDVSIEKVTYYKDLFLKDSESRGIVISRTLQSISEGGSTFFYHPVPQGQEIVFNITSVPQGCNLTIGFVTNDGDGGFVETIYIGSNINTNKIYLRHRKISSSNYIKIYCNTIGLEYEIYDVTNFASSIDKITSNTILRNAAMSSSVSWYKQPIESDNLYQVIISNVSLGSNVSVGSNDYNAGGFKDTFITIMSAKQNEYSTIVRASMDCEAIKCFSSDGNAKCTIKQYVLPAQATGDSTGFVRFGYETNGAGRPYCIGIGSRTMKNNTGQKNIAIGNDDMIDCSGRDNTAVGYHASFRNTSGSNNASFGSESQDDNTTGNDNTSVGFASLQRNNTGVSNTAVGNYALNGNNLIPYDENNPKSFNRNTALGAETMYKALSGSDDNIAIGYKALPGEKVYNNCIAIGNEVDCSKDNQIKIGNATHTEIVLLGNKKLVFNNDNTVRWEAIS